MTVGGSVHPSPLQPLPQLLPQQVHMTAPPTCPPTSTQAHASTVLAP